MRWGDLGEALRRTMTHLLPATALAICLAGSPAWGHAFPEVRTVVLQVEPCHVAVLVGFRPASGAETTAILGKASSAPKSRGITALRDIMSTTAMAPLALSVDGKPLVATSVQAKLGAEPGGRPMVVLLVTYVLPAGHQLVIASREPRTTRFSWADQHSGRVAISAAPAQGTWHDGVASFLLELEPGDTTCAPLPSPSHLPPVPSSR